MSGRKKMKLVNSSKYNWKDDDYYSAGCKDTFSRMYLSIPEGKFKTKKLYWHYNINKYICPQAFMKPS